MSGAMIVQLIGLIAALVLVTRAVRSRRVDTRRTSLMAATWIAIIVVLTFVVTMIERS